MNLSLSEPWSYYLLSESDNRPVKESIRDVWPSAFNSSCYLELLDPQSAGTWRVLACRPQQGLGPAIRAEGLTPSLGGVRSRAFSRALPPPHFALLIAFAVFRTLQLHQAAGRIQSDFQLRIPPRCGPFAVKDPRSQAPLWPLGLCWSLLTTHRGALFSPEGLATTPQGQGCLGADRGPAPRFAVLLDQHRDLWALTLRRKRPRGRH